MLAVARRAARVRVAVVQTRSFVKAGDKVPINFQKEGKDPVIRQDKEYPEWLKRMDLPTRVELESKIQKEGLDNMDVPELKRYLKLTNRAQIKTTNAEQAV